MCIYSISRRRMCVKSFLVGDRDIFYLLQIVTRLLLTWWYNWLGHQQPRYWSNWPGILPVQQNTTPPPHPPPPPPPEVNSLPPVNGGWGISYEISLRWMPLDLTADMSTLVQVKAWCRQPTGHYLSQCWPRSMSPNGVTKPQWVEYQR